MKFFLLLSQIEVVLSKKHKLHASKRIIRALLETMLMRRFLHRAASNS
jgi:hypothetical protein